MDRIEANRDQPRNHFDDDALLELAESIQVHGILQPLLVRIHPDDSEKFLLLAGERRYRAAKIASLETVPCILREAEEEKALEIALVENIQRADLSPLEEAKAYKHLADRFYLTQEEISSRVGKSREAIANTIRLLQLPEPILTAIDDGRISVGHAKALLGVKETPFLMSLFEQITREELNVRETEQLIRKHLNGDAPSIPVQQAKEVKKNDEDERDVHIVSLENALIEAFQTKVKVKMRGKKKGKIEILFYNLDQLDDLLRRWHVEL